MGSATIPSGESQGGVNRLSSPEFVRRLKQDPRFKRLPIIVLAPSGQVEDVCQTYAAGANAYLWKPVERTRFIDVIEHIEKFWLETVELPSEC